MAADKKGVEQLVSIIIPCYNYSMYLPDTLKSIQAQSYSNWECWIIDDGSTDETSTIVNEFSNRDTRIKYFYQDNQGQAVARNTGLQKAHGFFIQFLDADDLLESDKIQQQLNYLNKHPETDIVYGPVRYFASADPSILFKNRWDDKMKEWMPQLSGKGFRMIEAFVDGNILELGCALFRQSAVQKIGLFDEQLQGVEDYEYCFRAAMADLFFTYCERNKVQCLMRHHTESFSKNVFHMYKKELMLRRQMEEKLTLSGFDTLTPLNRKKYAWRLKKLQEIMITDTLRGKKIHYNFSDMTWVCINSGLRENLFFLPRILKAFVTGSLLNNR